MQKVGDWQKICDLGSGAFGVVSLWRNNKNEEDTAIKICKFKTNTILSEKQKERWNKEVDMMKIINHPNIIKFKKIPEDLQEFLMKNNPSKLPLLPMEYCRKGNLGHVLVRPQNISGMEEDDVRIILEDISNGLKHLHNLKITHRDLKPDNIVLQHCDNRKTGTIYKIIDLGYAKELGDSVVSFVGTLHYLAPEIFEAQNYTNSVDYWSMGILTFQVICGILPFLANLNPFERFEKIKKKLHDDICIFFNYSGQITYSSEIKKENLISTCLKHDMEIWLRQVLIYDQNIRCNNFPDGIKPLDYLQGILNKKIVNVFSICKLEFYSYEVTEGTQIGTLKDWISRDIKVAKSDLLLLISKDAVNVRDNDLLLNVTEHTIYVTRKHFLPDNLTYSFPKLIREVMKSAAKFNMRYLKPLRSQLIYFITIEKRVAVHFKTSFHLYLNFLNHMLSKVKNLKMLTISKVNKLVSKIDCYNKMKIQNTCDIDLRNNIEYKECLGYAQRLLASFERSISKFAQLDKKIKGVSDRLKVLSQVTPQIQIIVESYDLTEEYQKALQLVEKTNDINSNSTQINQLISGITKVISNTIKIKEKVLRHKELQAFSRAIGNIMTHSFELMKWIMDYNSHNEELFIFFEQNEAFHLNILLNAAKQPKSDTESVSYHNCLRESLNQELLNLPTPNLINQNRELRYRFEEILSFRCPEQNYETFLEDY